MISNFLRHRLKTISDLTEVMKSVIHFFLIHAFNNFKLVQW